MLCLINLNTQSPLPATFQDWQRPLTLVFVIQADQTFRRCNWFGTGHSAVYSIEIIFEAVRLGLKHYIYYGLSLIESARWKF